VLAAGHGLPQPRLLVRRQDLSSLAGDVRERKLALVTASYVLSRQQLWLSSAGEAAGARIGFSGA
jgi:hypothetical protein